LDDHFKKTTDSGRIKKRSGEIKAHAENRSQDRGNGQQQERRMIFIWSSMRSDHTASTRSTVCPVSDHGFGPEAQAEGYGHLVPPTSRTPAMPRQCRLPYEKRPASASRCLFSGSRLSQRPDRTGQAHHCFPMILIAVRPLFLRARDHRLQQGRKTTRRWPNAIAKAVCKAAFSVLMPPTSASAWRARSAPRSRDVRAASD